MSPGAGEDVVVARTLVFVGLIPVARSLTGTAFATRITWNIAAWGGSVGRRERGPAGS